MPMSHTILTAEVPAPRARPNYSHISDAMLYDIARHTASVLSAILLNLCDAVQDDAEREHWEARFRLVAQQTKALDPDDRAGMIAQDEVWRLEKLALIENE